MSDVRAWIKQKFNIRDDSDMAPGEIAEMCRQHLRDKKVSFADPGKGWAEKLRDREEWGEVLTPLQRKAWREALGVEDGA